MTGRVRFAPAAVALLAACCVFSSWNGCVRRLGTVARSERPVQGVVLLVGDGLGDQEITAARNVGPGATGRLHLDALPVRGWVLTASLQEAYPHLSDYVVDSAASATAWATGSRTSNGRISTAVGTDRPLPTLLEQAQQRGSPVGIVTTSEVTDATPAAQFAHVNSRFCQGPRDMRFCPQFRKENGGPGSIAEQAVARRIDVLLGGGRERFEQTTEDGRSLLVVLRERGDRVLTSAHELQDLDAATAPIIGLFAGGDFEPRWKGEPAQPYPGSGPQTCRENQRPAAQPSLVAMTETALRVLQQRAQRTGRPFFLQVEGANIDKTAHAARPCEQLGETLEFDEAVGAVLRFADAHPDALVVVTADHAHSTQIVPFPGAWSRPPGLLSTITTREGSLLTLLYATQMLGGAQTHTGSQVPVLARGPFAERLAGTHEQTQIYHVLRAALGLGD